jgi:hypothetical protein
MGLQPVGPPHPGHGDVGDAEAASEQPGGPVGDPERLGRAGQGGRDDSLFQARRESSWPPWPGLVLQPGEPCPGVAIPPQQDGGTRAPHPLGDLGGRQALRREQDDPGSLHIRAGEDTRGRGPLSANARHRQMQGSGGRRPQRIAYRGREQQDTSGSAPRPVGPA